MKTSNAMPSKIRSTAIVASAVDLRNAGLLGERVGAHELAGTQGKHVVGHQADRVDSDELSRADLLDRTKQHAPSVGAHQQADEIEPERGNEIPIGNLGERLPDCRIVLAAQCKKEEERR